MAPDKDTADDAVTLWSQTLFDLLVVAIKRRNDVEVLQHLNAIRARGFRKRAVIEFLRSRMSDKDIAYCERVVVLMGRSGGPSVRNVKNGQGTASGRGSGGHGNDASGRNDEAS